MCTERMHTHTHRGVRNGKKMSTRLPNYQDYYLITGLFLDYQDYE